MLESITFLIPPLLICVILVGLHCYLGIHVLAREVIFLDLSLAQVAAFGSILSVLFHVEESSYLNYFISLSCALLVSLFFSLANQYRHKFSQEALIGIVYAFITSFSILLSDKIHHGAEHIKQMLSGKLLWVTWEDVVKVALIYTIVAVIHYIFRKQMLKHSFEKYSHWKWDFLFFSLFSVVITSSVHIAGVLLVFSFLIVPALLSQFYSQNILKRLAFGWLLGTILSTVGLSLSYYLDSPAGATTVIIFTIVPIISVILFIIKKYTFNSGK